MRTFYYLDTMKCFSSDETANFQAFRTGMDSYAWGNAACLKASI